MTEEVQVLKIKQFSKAPKKKTALMKKSRVDKIYVGEECKNLVDINADLLWSFFVRFGDFYSENPIFEICGDFNGIRCRR